MYREISNELLNFIEKNPTSFHVVETIKKELEACGFKELREVNEWEIERGGAYFVARSASSIIAFKVGKDVADPYFHITASHSDSPTFKLKEKPELKNGAYVRINTEGYGGMICSTWLDRPLSIAGRVLTGKGNQLKQHLVKFEKDLVLIPNTAIHMNRGMNENTSYNKQVDMIPLFAGKGSEMTIRKLLAKELDLKEEDIIGSDLYLYSREHGSIWGAEDEYVSMGHLDDQQCVFASLKALEAAGNDKTISVFACFDNEEVGSGTKQGANSTFFSDTLKRVVFALGGTETDYLRSIPKSFMLSADNAHAVHPNHPELTDAENCVYMNEGVVVKSHAGQKYTSDGESIAVVKLLADKANVPLQYFANRSDKAGGSTLGNIALGHLSVRCADIGLPQLAMHSAYETAGVKDTKYMIDLIKELYNAEAILIA